MKVVAAGDAIEYPLYLERMSNTLYRLLQLWIFRQPDTTTNNPHFVIMNANSGFVWNVHDAAKTPVAHIKVYNRHNQFNEQFFFSTIKWKITMKDLKREC